MYGGKGQKGNGRDAALCFAALRMTTFYSVPLFISQLLIRIAEADDMADRGKAVPPGDLFAVGVIPAMVLDGDLVDAPAAFGDLGGEFRLHPEAVALYLDG